MAQIRLENVTVDYPVYEIRTQSLRRAVLHYTTGGLIREDQRQRTVVEALCGVSLDINTGDRLALIGPNGAGKTTLLQVMAGLCYPTTGRVTVDGRVSSLFNVTSAMDPELTGYDNIYYMGLLLGLKKPAVTAMLPDIEDFTELGDYLLMPVRTYSSGMMVRLAFAVATAIHPDILLLDEAIGAGDAHFVNKAKKRADALYAKANILVMASHSAPLLRELCTTGLLLNHGRVIAHGPIDDVLRVYESDNWPRAGQPEERPVPA
jgi:ABC-type polysaccharide/polyol phosphate transport system ATPase subunit